MTSSAGGVRCRQRWAERRPSRGGRSVRRGREGVHRRGEPTDRSGPSHSFTRAQHGDHQPIPGSVLSSADSQRPRRHDLGRSRLPSNSRLKSSCQCDADHAAAVLPGTQRHRESVALAPQQLLVEPRFRQIKHTAQPTHQVPLSRPPAPAAPESSWGSVLFVAAMVIGGIFLFSMVMRMFGSGGQSYGSGESGGVGGGGSMSGLTGGIFGALAGNWLNNRFSDHHVSASETHSVDRDLSDSSSDNSGFDSDSSENGGTDFGGDDFGGDF